MKNIIKIIKMSSYNYFYVDGAFNKITSKENGEAWASVVDKNGIDMVSIYKDLLYDMKLKEVELPVGKRTVICCKFDDVNSQQINGAELLAMVAGLRIANYFINNRYEHRYIYSDSNLIVKYWSLNGGKNIRDPNKVKYVRECMLLRIEYEKHNGQIIKISGNDNLADLGWHR